MALDTQAQIGSLAEMLATPEGRLRVAEILAGQGLTPQGLEQDIAGVTQAPSALGGQILGDQTLVGGPAADVLATAPAAPAPVPTPIPTPTPAPAPAPAPEEKPGDSILEALAAVIAPPAPPVPTLPTGQAPLPRLGGSVDPRLLEQIRSILTTQVAAPPSSLGAAAVAPSRASIGRSI